MRRSGRPRLGLRGAMVAVAIVALALGIGVKLRARRERFGATARRHMRERLKFADWNSNRLYTYDFDHPMREEDFQKRQLYHPGLWPI